MHDIFYRSLLRTTGAIAAALRIRRPTIFCFHSVSADGAPESEKGSMALDAGFFDALAVRLAKLGIPVIALDEAVARLRRREFDPFVVLTFDDGYRDVHANFFPVALRHRLPFTIFVTTGLVDRGIAMWWELVERCRATGLLTPACEARLLERAGATRFDRVEAALRAMPTTRQRALVAELRRLGPDLPDPYELALSWDMLREMQASGLLTAGAHSVRHLLFARLSADELRCELRTSRQRIETELDIELSWLAYPFGQRSEVGTTAIEMAHDLGFDDAFSTEARPLSAADLGRRFFLPRVLLARKAQHPDIALAYMSGLPTALNRLAGRGAAA